jgi:guanyl-specific ribonuclease Sa
MRTLRFILVLSVAGVLLYLKYEAGSPAGNGRSSYLAPAPGIATAATQHVPLKALRVLEIVRSTGSPPPGYVGGTVFQNREGQLPEAGNYREFDVDPHYGQRNPERIIVDWRTKQAWYTGDHYRTFIPLP